MGKGRLEAFNDGVIANIITIMVLELNVPHGATFDDLLPVLVSTCSASFTSVSTGTSSTMDVTHQI